MGRLGMLGIVCDVLHPLDVARLCFAVEQGTQFLLRDGLAWVEGLCGHIHLQRIGICPSFHIFTDGNKVGGAHEQPAFPHPELHQNAQFVVSLHIVNGLDDRTVILGQAVEDKWTGMKRNAPPLPVGSALSGEGREDGMLRVH